MNEAKQFRAMERKPRSQSETRWRSSAGSNQPFSRVVSLARGVAFAAAIFFAHPSLFAGQSSKSSAHQDAHVTGAAVWNPSPDALAAIRNKCGEEAEAAHQENCFLDEMKFSGASPEAMAFTKSFANIGVIYMRAFRTVEPVDIAYIEYAFRANELDGVFLVNGDPSPIDVDDEDLVPKSRLQKNASYAALARQFPNISIWPSDRFDTSTPALSNSGWGTQTFLINYILCDGCHACAQIGTATIAFDFDNQGKFQATRVSSVIASTGSPNPSGANNFGSAGVEQIRVLTGKEFSITLHSNHTTGYSWRLATTLDPANLKLFSNVYNQPTSGKAGAPGEEVWTFSTQGKGTAPLHFEYVRPFEKNVAPVKTADFSLTIE